MGYPRYLPDISLIYPRYSPDISHIHPFLRTCIPEEHHGAIKLVARASYSLDLRLVEPAAVELVSNFRIELCPGLAPSARCVFVHGVTPTHPPCPRPVPRTCGGVRIEQMQTLQLCPQGAALRQQKTWISR